MQAAALLIAAVIGSGCYRTRTVSRPQSGQQVTVRYGDPAPSLAVVTRRNGVVTIPSARSVTASVIVVRGDSLDVEILATKPWNRDVAGGRAVLPLPGVTAAPQMWTTQEFSPRRTAALILGPPAVLLGLLILLISAASPGMS